MARFVGSPVMFVASIATTDKTINKKTETERIVLVWCDYGQGKERYCMRRCCCTRIRTALFKIVLPSKCLSKYLYILISMFMH